MGMALIRELFTHFIEAAQALGVDTTLAQELDQARSGLVARYMKFSESASTAATCRLMTLPPYDSQSRSPDGQT